MDKLQLQLVEGDRQAAAHHLAHDAVARSVSDAIHAGYRVGRRVRIGRVSGRVVGYNIGNFGRFCGAAYPLLVKTAYGLAKCSTRELDWDWDD